MLCYSSPHQANKSWPRRGLSECSVKYDPWKLAEVRYESQEAKVIGRLRTAGHITIYAAVVEYNTERIGLKSCEDV